MLKQNSLSTKITLRLSVSVICFSKTHWIVYLLKTQYSYRAVNYKEHRVDFQKNLHCVKSFQIRSFFWSVFSHTRTEYGNILRKSPYSVRIWKNTDQKKLRIEILFTQCLWENLQSKRKKDMISITELVLNVSWRTKMFYRRDKATRLFKDCHEVKDYAIVNIVKPT